MEVKGAWRSSERNHGKYFVPNRQRRISGSLWLAIDRGNWFEIRGAMECIGNQISCPPAPPTLPSVLLPRSLSSFRQTGNEGCARERESFPGILRMWRRPGMLGAAVVIVMVVGWWLLYFPPPLSFHLLAIHRNSTITTTLASARATSVQVMERRIGSKCVNGRAICGDSQCRVRLGHYLRKVYVWMRSEGAGLMPS